LTLDYAKALSQGLGGSTEFWMNRECQYRDDLQRSLGYQAMVSTPPENLIEFGWMAKGSSAQSQLQGWLDFFGVEDYAEWDQRCKHLWSDGKFRAPTNLKSSPGALAAWLRQGEIEAAQNSCAPFDPSALRLALPELKRLTLRKRPAEFIPLLMDIGRSVGVSINVLRAPKGCRVSGVARFLSPGAAQIILSARQLSDDQFWFTFFHEVGHLLLHGSEDIYLDDIGLGEDSALTSEEKEADAFAFNTLVPADIEPLKVSEPAHKQLIAIAKKNGVSPGVLVGVLQMKGRLPYRNHNTLKRRYRWNGVILENA
jgi:HTH-type transcriptional regulator / antitoxin HigA